MIYEPLGNTKTTFETFPHLYARLGHLHRRKTMPYANDFIKIDIIGDCYDQAEIWNTGLKVNYFGPSSIDEGILTSAAESIADAWETFFTITGGSSGLSFSSAYRSKEVKASHVGVDGKVVGNTYTHFYETPIKGVHGGEYPVPQSAVVGSFRSSKQRGPGSQGRMYLPGISYELGSDGLMKENAVRELANEFSAFINEINNIGGAIGAQFQVILTSPVGDGAELPVVQTGLDRKVDTQRRRANAMGSDYSTNEVI